jgi:hypothetical protein
MYAVPVAVWTQVCITVNLGYNGSSGVSKNGPL